MMNLRAATCVMALLVLAACKDKQETVTIQDQNGSKITIEQAAPDSQQIQDFKSDIPKLKTTLERCHAEKENSTECRSAYLANKELTREASARAREQPKKFERFRGGSYDLKKQ